MKSSNELVIIGRAEHVGFPALGLLNIPAKTDTGAKTSAIWASGIIEDHGVLRCVLFGPDSKLYSGEILEFTHYETRTVASSIGEAEERYVVKLLVELKGKKIRANFTLANRSEQAYPILLGRNVLRGKFVVDVKQGTPAKAAERARSAVLQNRLKRKEQ